MQPDFGKTAQDYSRYRQGFPDELFGILGRMGVMFSGARAVDLGTGTGSVGRGMARRGADVTGVDPSRELTAEAQRLDLEWGVGTRYINSTAEKTGLESDGFDIVTAGQCWWWFDRDAALTESMRILKPGGVLAICSFDWLPAQGNVVAITESLIERHNPDWTMGSGNGCHPEFILDLQHGGFSNVRSEQLSIDALYTKQAWRGRVRASAGVGASLSPELVDAFDRELADGLEDFSASDPIPVPHKIFVAAGSKPVR